MPPLRPSLTFCAVPRAEQNCQSISARLSTTSPASLAARPPRITKHVSQGRTPPCPPKFEFYPLPSSPAPTHLHYLVSRTPSTHFPVYHVTRQTNKHTTVLKKVEGNKNQLVADLSKMLGVPAPGSKEYDKRNKHVVIEPVTGNLRIKGHRKEEINRWLYKQGF